MRSGRAVLVVSVAVAALCASVLGAGAHPLIDAGPVPEWVRTVPVAGASAGGAVVVGADGDVRVVGSSVAWDRGQGPEGSNDGFAARYSPQGGLRWVSQVPVAGVDDHDQGLEFADAVVTADGTLVAVGWAAGDLPGQELTSWAGDALIVTWDDGGALAWIEQFSDEGAPAQLAGVALAADGDIVVAGQLANQALIRRYSATGALRWEHRWDQAAASAASDVDVAPDGAIHVTIETVAGGLGAHGSRWLVLDPDGAEIASTDLTDAGFDAALRAVSVGPAGDVWFAGGLVDGDLFGHVSTVARYDRDRRETWRTSFTNPDERAGQVHATHDLVVEADGTAHVTGITSTSPEFVEGREDGGFTAQVSSSGALRWFSPWGAPNLGDAVSAASDGDGALYTTGVTYPDPFLDEIDEAYLVRLDRDGAAPAPVGGGDPSGFIRIAGTDRFDTAAQLSGWAYPEPNVVTTVYVATGLDFPDALSGGVGAAAAGGPVLLTLPGEVPEPTRAELARLAPDQVVVVGGTSVISDTVATRLGQVAGEDVEVHRIAGVDRFDTAARVSAHVFPGGGMRQAFVATGLDFPDALSGVAIAAPDAPILLSARDAVPQPTLDELGGAQVIEIVALGGSSVLSGGVIQSLGDHAAGVTRIAGADRFETSARIASGIAPGGTVFVATGATFPDALAGGSIAAQIGGPVLLTARDVLPEPVRAELERLAPARIVILGGASAVGPAVEAELRNLVD